MSSERGNNIINKSNIEIMELLNKNWNLENEIYQIFKYI